VAGPGTVSGEIVFPPDAPVLQAGTVRVLVEDVSLADAGATVVGETVLDGAGAGAGSSLQFAVNVPQVNDAQHYSVRVHVDADGSGAISTGDLVSTQAHPVLTFGAPERVVVAVQRIV